MADDKTTKTPEQPVTDSGPGKETPPAPQKEPEKVSVSPEPEKKTEPEVKTPQVSVYNFAEIMKEKKAEERAAAPGVEKPDPAKTEKPEKQPEAPKKAEEKPKEPEQPKRRGRPPKADKDKAAAPKPKAPAQKPEKAVKKEPEKKAAPTVQAASAPKGPEKPKDAPRRGKEQIVYIKLNELHAFKNHPFEVRDDEEMRAMVSSVKDKGVTQPAIVRPREDGGYEIVSGHRRQKASELAGYADMPCIVRNLTDDEAITQMVEDNLNQREEILPSERAKALKMQLEAIKHQGSRTSGQIDPKDAGKRSNEIVAERNKMAVKQVQRYIRLNELVPDLMKLMDEKKLGFTTAVELSYIGKKNQNYIAVAIDSQQSSPSQAQAKRMRELDEKKLLNGDVIDGIMMEDKKEVDKVILTGAELSKYFGKETTPREMKDQIIKLLDDWNRKQDCYICGSYKKRTRDCTAHFIRTDLLTAGVLSNLRQVTEYAAKHESRFVKLLIQQNEIGGKRKTAAATKQLEQAQERIAEVSRIIKRLYEDNVNGKISDERFMELSADYEQEQRELKDRAAALQAELDKSQAATVNAEKFMGIVRKHLAFEELTPTLLREMIEKIVVHECSYDENGTRRQDIEIYYSFVGKIDLPEA